MTYDKPLSDPMMAQFTDACMHHSASMSLLNFSYKKCI